MKLYAKDVEEFTVTDDFELSLGQLYKLGILQIKKQLENGNFIIFISLTEAGKELLKHAEFPMQ